MSEYRSNTVGDVRVYDMIRDGRFLKLSAHFQLYEFACSDGSHVVLIHPSLVDLLEKARSLLRERFSKNIAINITSGYRTVSHNKSEGGRPHSRHVLGMACDISAYYTHKQRRLYIPPEDVADIIEELNPGGLGRYNTFTHVDVDGENRRWDNRSS